VRAVDASCKGRDQESKLRQTSAAGRDDREFDVGFHFPSVTIVLRVRILLPTRMRVLGGGAEILCCVFDEVYYEVYHELRCVCADLPLVHSGRRLGYGGSTRGPDL